MSIDPATVLQLSATLDELLESSPDISQLQNTGILNSSNLNLKYFKTALESRGIQADFFNTQKTHNTDSFIKLQVSESFVKIAKVIADAMSNIQALSYEHARDHQYYSHVEIALLPIVSTIKDFREFEYGACGFDLKILNELDHELLASLSGLVTRLLQEEPDIGVIFSLLLEQDSENSSLTKFLYEGGWCTLFEIAPVLFRQIVTVAEEWILDTTILWQRFSQDRALFIQLGEPYGTRHLVKISLPLSDRHLYPGRVRRFTFDDGWSLIYKPRPLTGELFWQNLSKWFDSIEPAQNIITSCVCIKLNDYGWMQDIHSLECISFEEVDRFYRRVGALAAITILLNSSDLHYENIIAHGEYPVVIDLETIWQADLAKSSSSVGNEVDFVRQQLSWCCLFGSNAPLPGGEAFLASAFDTQLKKNYNQGSQKVGNIDLSTKEIIQSSLPKLKMETMDFGQFTNQIVEGFRETLTILSNNQDNFLLHLKKELILNPYFRTVIISTAGYHALLSRAQTRSSFTNGLTWSLGFDLSIPTLLERFDKFHVEQILRSQSKTLSSLAIPKFQMAATDTILRDELGNILFELPGLDAYKSTVNRTHELTTKNIESLSTALYTVLRALKVKE